MGHLHRFAKAAWPALLCALLTLRASAGGQDDMADMPCPGAIAWNQAHPEESDAALLQRDAARTFSDPGLRAELAARFQTDQAARVAWLADRKNAGVLRYASSVDADNLAWLSRVVRSKGFPTAAQVGERGVRNAWLLTQHADRAPEFQAALLPVLEQRHAEGELDGMTLSRFIDRVLKAQGQPQRYGTQFTPAQWKTAHFGLPDAHSVETVDINRRALGVMPLADYVCMMGYARRHQID